MNATAVIPSSQVYKPVTTPHDSSPEYVCGRCKRLFPKTLNGHNHMVDGEMVHFENPGFAPIPGSGIKTD